MLIKLADVNPDVALIINTSLNHLSDKFLTVLNKFNNLTFAISLDGVGQLNDYIRNGSEFATVIDNIECIRHHQIMFSTCVSIYNVFDVPDIIRFVLTHYPEAEKNHWINNVNDLEELYVENTPPELRADIIKELREVLPITRENSTKGVENLIIALEQDNFNPKRFENFKRYTTILDQSRGEDICVIQPKLAKYFDK
jgi:sulfatase maturation enzyme AslB (radical SAM superfamily)